MSTRGYLSFGSNLGDRAGNLLFAVRGLLASQFTITRLSQIYQTEPISTFSQPLFLNMVGEFEVPDVSAHEALTRLLKVEESLGRTREVAKGPRNIDLDLLFYGTETSDTNFLQLPHPRLHTRRFVLVPLAELAPELVHPVLNKSVRELLKTVSDRSEVNLWNPPAS
jgi:2-amino-4-hydroxy-6-hydroxymethyldihydropteridine diphosphokinase